MNEVEQVENEMRQYLDQEVEPEWDTFERWANLLTKFLEKQRAS